MPRRIVSLLIKTAAGIAGAALLHPLTASAQDSNAADFGVFAEVGTFGLGGGLALQFNERFSARASYSRLSADIDDYEAEDLEFDADATIAAAKVLFDWYPTPGVFRVTAGAMLNKTHVSGEADPTGGGYVINGTFYPAFLLGTATGRVDFDDFAPYIGVGWGRALDTQGRFNVLVDVGAAFVNEPDIVLTASCANAVPTGLCAQIQQDLDQEEAELRDDTDDIGLGPYANVSFSWRF